MTVPDVERVDTHRCPIAGCHREVVHHHLMCARHWRLVSRNLRGRLYECWDRGRGAGSQEHIEAMRLCVEEVEWKLALEEVEWKLAQELVSRG